MLVAQHLDFDVARAFDELLDEDAVVAEAVQPLALGRFKAFADILFAIGEAHALAAAAGRGLHHHRIADLVGDLHRMFGVVDHADKARDDIDARFHRQLLGFDLVAHRGDGIRRRADEDDALGVQRLAEAFALGEEAIARMDGVGAGRLAGLDDLVGQQIGLGGGRRADMDGFIGHQHMRRAGVGIGIDRDGLDAHLLGRARDTARNFATVRDQDLGDGHVITRFPNFSNRRPLSA